MELDRLDLGLLDDATHAFKPDVFAFSAVTHQMPHVKALVAHARATFPWVTTILGGVHAILCRDVIDEIPGLDALCVSEGERPLLDYVRAVEFGILNAPIPGLRIRVGQEFMETPESFAMAEDDLTGLPFEDRELFRKWRETPKGIRLESVGIRPRFLFSRGCNFGCTFCCLPTLRHLFPAKKFVRYPTAERAIAEVEAVADRWTFSTYVIDDDVFLHRPAWIVNEWAAQYPERLKHLRYEANSRVECVNDETMRALKETGCSLLKFGIEAGDPAYRREVYGRHITNERITYAFALARKYGIGAHSFNILCGPGETRRQMWRTVRLNHRVRPDRCQVSLFAPYPNTALAKELEAKGIATRHVENYFTDSPLDQRHLWRWEPRLFAKVFRLFVYARYSPRLAWAEVVGLAKWVRDKVRKKQ